MREQLLRDDVAIVTGGAAGIGRAIAAAFVEEGANVVIADVDETTGAETESELEGGPGEIRFVPTDVTDAAQVETLVETTVDAFGGLDVLVNNAGGSFDDAKLTDVTEEIWDRNIDVNLKGPFLCSKYAVPAMVESGGGRLVHMSSVNALTGIALQSYSAAKSGILSLSELIATQYGYHGIRSNAICPGTIMTETRQETMDEKDSSDMDSEWLDQYNVGRMGRPEDVANAALYLASPMSSFVTGAKLVVDGGLTAGLGHTIEQKGYDIEAPPTTE